MAALRRANDFTFIGVVPLATFNFFGLGATAAPRCRRLMMVLLFNEKGRCLALLLELARDDDFGLFGTVIASFVLLLLALLCPDGCTTGEGRERRSLSCFERVLAVISGLVDLARIKTLR